MIKKLLVMLCVSFSLSAAADSPVSLIISDDIRINPTAWCNNIIGRSNELSNWTQEANIPYLETQRRAYIWKDFMWRARNTTELNIGEATLLKQFINNFLQEQLLVAEKFRRENFDLRR